MSDGLITFLVIAGVTVFFAPLIFICCRYEENYRKNSTKISATVTDVSKSRTSGAFGNNTVLSVVKFEYYVEGVFYEKKRLLTSLQFNGEVGDRIDITYLNNPKRIRVDSPPVPSGLQNGMSKKEKKRTVIILMAVGLAIIAAFIFLSFGDFLSDWGELLIATFYIFYILWEEFRLQKRSETVRGTVNSVRPAKKGEYVTAIFTVGEKEYVTRVMRASEGAYVKNQQVDVKYVGKKPELSCIEGHDRLKRIVIATALFFVTVGLLLYGFIRLYLYIKEL